MNEDNEVFSAAKVRKHFEGVLKYGGYLMKKITEAIENSKKDCKCKREGLTDLQRGA